MKLEKQIQLLEQLLKSKQEQYLKVGECIFHLEQSLQKLKVKQRKENKHD